MDTDQALVTLGLRAGASWDDIRRAYRTHVRAAHPDLAPDEPAATAATAIINEAYAVLDAATDGGAASLPEPPPPPAAPMVEHVVVAPRRDVFGLLLEAGHRIGDVSYVSPEDGMIQVLVTPPGGPLCQLLAEVRPGEQTRVAFALESMDATPAPPIEDVVKQFLAAVRAELRT